MSHIAIAAALALEEVSAGERLTAFSLASFANREHSAWPGTRVAAARAGLSRSQYLAARDGLEKRCVIAVKKSAGGRGRSAVITLRFAETGPWFEGEINAPLFETMLGYSRARGSARVLLATLAAIADERLEVSGLATEVIRDAAGMADSTYRRARAALLASGEVLLGAAGGGRARTNRWLVCDPRSINPEPAVVQRDRVAPGRLARPLMAAAKEPPGRAARDDEAPQARGREGGTGPELSGVSGLNPGQIRMVCVGKSPGLSGVSGLNPAQNRTVCVGKGPGLTGVSGLNPAQNRTVSPETPPETPPQTPPSNVRAGTEPQNPRTKNNPPSPPEGGSDAAPVTIAEDYVNERGRRRQRTVTVEIASIRAQFAEPDAVDRSDWDQIRSEMSRIAGESIFDLWLSELEPVAVDQAGSLVLACPPPTRAWVAERYGRLLELAGRSVNRQLKVATDREMQLLAALADAASFESAASPRVPEPDASGTEARGPAPGRPNDRAAGPSSPVPPTQQTRAAAR
jgi:hypothetical protein